MKEYYIVIFIFKGSRYITLWYMSDRDGFLLNKEGNKIKTFNSEIEVKEYVRKNMLDLQNGITEVFCDETELLNDNNVKCDLFLTFWNIMSDVASSLNINFKGDDEDKEIKVFIISYFMVVIYLLLKMMEIIFNQNGIIKREI